MTGPADNPFYILTLTVGTGQFYFLISPFKDLFKDKSAFRAPELKNWHLKAPTFRYMMLQYFNSPLIQLG